jgi:hypothetical protein
LERVGYCLMNGWGNVLFLVSIDYFLNMFKATTKLFLILSAVCWCGSAYGQQLTPADQANNMQSITNANSMFRSFDNRYQGVKGGVTLLGSYVPGKIRMLKGPVYKHERLNYDAFQDELLVMRSGFESVLPIANVKNFVLETPSDTLHFINLLGPDGKSGFYQKIIADGMYMLYIKNYKDLIEPNYQGAYSAGRNYSELVPAKKYFIQEAGKPLKEFKNRKTFLQQFPNQSEKLEEFIKREKIDFKTEEDLKKLFSYLNEISVN